MRSTPAVERSLIRNKARRTRKGVFTAFLRSQEELLESSMRMPRTTGFFDGVVARFADDHFAQNDSGFPFLTETCNNRL